REKHPDALQPHLFAAKNLMQSLYGSQPFFIDMAQKRPDFLNEILFALIRFSEETDKKLNAQHAKEIATVDLGDDELNTVFRKMLRGSLLDFEESGSNEAAAGYPSLIDFITILPNKHVIRVFLASSEVLTALYGNRQVVGQIIEMRN